MKYGDVVRCGPNSKTPGRWARILCLSPDGKRAYLAVFPEGHVQPEKPKYR